MRCPFCGTQDTKVVDSRLISDGAQVRRRRQCAECKERFTTYESAELNLPRIVKRDGSRVPFDIRKLRSGMLRALEKRPISTAQIESALSHIQHRLMSGGECEVSSIWIGELAMNELCQIDQVAYLRFASVYRKFADVNAFRDEIARLERQPGCDFSEQQLDLFVETDLIEL